MACRASQPHLMPLSPQSLHPSHTGPFHSQCPDGCACLALAWNALPWLDFAHPLRLSLNVPERSSLIQVSSIIPFCYSYYSILLHSSSPALVISLDLFSIYLVVSVFYHWSVRGQEPCLQCSLWYSQHIAHGKCSQNIYWTNFKILNLTPTKQQVETQAI